MADVRENRDAGAGDGDLTGERDDRDAHPESVAGGGAAVVGERIERDVDAIVGGEIIGERLFADEFDAREIDVVLNEELSGALEMAAPAGVNDEAGGGKRFENAHPRIEGLRADFGEVVETAKG